METTVPTKIMEMVFIASLPHVEIANGSRLMTVSCNDLPVAAGDPGDATDQEVMMGQGVSVMKRSAWIRKYCSGSKKDSIASPYDA